jgi:hypothetical protein
MNELSVVGMFVAVFCLGLVACDQFKAQPTKWEYQILYFQTNHPDDQINKLGKDGWELVTITSSEVRGTYAYFKRPIAQ